MSDDITYCTKVWGGELIEGLTRHQDADLVIGNNLGFKFVDMGQISDFYFLPELEAVLQCPTKYMLWYSGDVEPPITDWVSEAIPLLEDYPIVSCSWDNTPKDRAIDLFNAIRETEFGWETYYFSDQCYIAKTSTMRDIDYKIDHPIKQIYPKHGGNSFERRVAQWLAHNQTPMAVLSNHRYRHISAQEKSL